MRDIVFAFAALLFMGSFASACDRFDTFGQRGLSLGELVALQQAQQFRDVDRFRGVGFRDQLLFSGGQRFQPRFRQPVRRVVTRVQPGLIGRILGQRDRIIIQDVPNCRRCRGF